MKNRCYETVAPGLCLLLACGVGSLSLAGCSKQVEQLPTASAAYSPPPPPARVEASAAPGGDGVSTGTTFPIRQAALSSRVTGVLAELKITAGDSVKKGQLLFRVDGAHAASAVAQAQAGVRAAEVSAAAAQTEVDRSAKLAQKGVLAAATLEQNQASLDAAKASLAQAKAALNSAHQGLVDTSVHSPIDGIVAERNKEQGESVSGAGAPVLVIQDISSLEVRARFHERHLRSLRVGEQLMVRFPSLGLERPAKIARVHPSVDAATRTVEVVGELPNPGAELRAGMFVEVRLADLASPAATAANGQAAPAGAAK